MELHDAAIVAKAVRSSFHPCVDGLSTVYEAYRVVEEEDPATPTRMYHLVGEVATLTATDVHAACHALGEFGRELRVLGMTTASMRAHTSWRSPVGDDPVSPGETMAAVAEELGVVLPNDACTRYRRLVAKHTPDAVASPPRVRRVRCEPPACGSAVVSDDDEDEDSSSSRSAGTPTGPTLAASGPSLAEMMRMVRATLHRSTPVPCVCGNWAGADGACNACRHAAKRTRRDEGGGGDRTPS
jgi:hypothetical protein